MPTNLDIDALITAAGAKKVISLVDGETYTINAPVNIPDGLRIIGNGAKLVLKASYPITDPLLQTASSGFSNICIESCIFDGNNNSNTATPPRRQTAMVKLINVTGVRFVDCVFKNLGSAGLYIVNSTGVTIEGCEFTKLGSIVAESERGPPLFIASDNASTLAKDVAVSNCYFHGNFWSVLVACQNGSIVGNRFIDNIESGLYLPYDAENGTYVSDGVTITGNLIDGVTKAVVSASGIECHVRNSVIADNIIRNTQSHGISISRGRNVVIEGNHITGAGVGETQLYPNASGIAVLSGYPLTPAPTTDTNNVVIRDNRIYDGGASRMRYGVIAAPVGANQGETAAVGTARFCSILGNDFTNSSWAPSATIAGTTYPAGKPLNLITTAWWRDNSVGADGWVPYSGTVTLVATSPSNTLFTSCPFRPNSMIIHAILESTTKVVESVAHISINNDNSGLDTPAYRIEGQCTTIDPTTTPAATYKAQAHTKAINLVGGAAAVYVADFNQFLDNGFQLTVSAGSPAGANCTARFTLFP